MKQIIIRELDAGEGKGHLSISSEGFSGNLEILGALFLAAFSHTRVDSMAGCREVDELPIDPPIQTC